MILSEEQLERLKAFLQERQVSNVDLAAVLACSESQVSRILNRERPFAPRYQVRFARAYEIKTYLDIFGGPEETPEVELVRLTEVYHDGKH